MIPIIIPFFRNQEQLAKCKDAIRAQDGLTSQCPDFIIDDSETVNGFTKTVNAGIRAARNANSTYVCVLNQDCYLKPDAIEKMIAFMADHPRCAIAGIKQLSSKDQDQIIHGGTLECYPAGRHEGGLVSRGDCNMPKQVPWVNGACMIVRLSAIAEFGLMDENMKMFGSDADWSFTARARGWETWYIADAVCVHEQGASKNMDEKMGRTFDRDMLYFRDKWITGEVFRDLSLEVFQ